MNTEKKPRMRIVRARYSTGAGNEKYGVRSRTAPFQSTRREKERSKEREKNGKESSRLVINGQVSKEQNSKQYRTSDEVVSEVAKKEWWGRKREGEKAKRK